VESIWPSQRATSSEQQDPTCFLPWKGWANTDPVIHGIGDHPDVQPSVSKKTADWWKDGEGWYLRRSQRRCCGCGLNEMEWEERPAGIFFWGRRRFNVRTFTDASVDSNGVADKYRRIAVMLRIHHETSTWSFSSSHPDAPSLQHVPDWNISLILPLFRRSRRRRRRCGGHDPSLFLRREHARALLQRADQDWQRIVLEVVGIADTVEVLGEFLGRPLQVVGRELGRDLLVRFCGRFLRCWRHVFLGCLRPCSHNTISLARVVFCFDFLLGDQFLGKKKKVAACGYWGCWHSSFSNW